MEFTLELANLESPTVEAASSPDASRNMLTDTGMDALVAHYMTEGERFSICVDSCVDSWGTVTDCAVVASDGDAFNAKVPVHRNFNCG